jgi:hypothetical protein
MATLLAPRRTQKTREPVPTPIRGIFRKCGNRLCEAIIVNPVGRYIVTCDTCEQLLYRCNTAAEAVRFAQEHGDGSVFVQDRGSRVCFHISQHQAFIRNLPLSMRLPAK